ncbi:MAG: hypothetical protein AB1411_04870 [Nitrospirota bacterium]
MTANIPRMRNAKVSGVMMSLPSRWTEPAGAQETDKKADKQFNEAERFGYDGIQDRQGNRDFAKVVAVFRQAVSMPINIHENTIAD